MKNTKLLIGALFVLAVAVAGFYFLNRTPFSERPPVPGQVAPRIALADLSGKMIRLSQRPDDVVLIFFWASWCGPCKDQLQVFERVYRDLAEKGLTILAIATDDIAESFPLEAGLTFPVLRANERVTREYGNIRSVPATFLIDRSRRIVEKHTGYDAEATLREKIESLRVASP